MASIIRIAKNYDEAASLGHARPVIFEWLLKNRNSYLPEGLEALSRIRNYSDGVHRHSRSNLQELQKGMRIQQDLRLSNGYLLAPKGSVITDAFFP